MSAAKVVARVWITSPERGQAFDAISISFEKDALVLVGSDDVESRIPYKDVGEIQVTIPQNKYLNQYWLSCRRLMSSADVPENYIDSQIKWHTSMATQLQNRKKP